MEKSMIPPNPNDPPIFRDISAEQQQLYIDIHNYILFTQEQINNLRADINNYRISYDNVKNQELYVDLMKKVSEIIKLRDTYFYTAKDEPVEKVHCKVNVQLNLIAKKDLQILKKIENELIPLSKWIDRPKFWNKNSIEMLYTLKTQFKDFYESLSLARSAYNGNLVIEQ